jgi:hypothetical protein
MMKKVMIFCLVLFLLNGVDALSMDLKENYAPGENILAEISGSILQPISIDQVELKRVNVLVPIKKDIKRLGEKEFFWAIAPMIENNYTLYIYNVTTNVAGEVKKVDLIKNFSVRGNLTDYSIDPGFIFTTENFSLSIFLYEDFKREINVSFPYGKNFLLSPGENSIEFSIDDFVGENFITINVGKYALPAYIIGKKNETSTTSSGAYIEFRPIRIQRTIFLSERPIYAVEIINTGSSSLNELIMYYDNSSFYINPSRFIDIKPNQSVLFNMSLINTTKNNISQFVYAVGTDINISLPVAINVTSNATIVTTNGTNQKSNYYCAELNGVICSASEVCSLMTVVSLDGNCCKGRCQVPNKSSSSAWVGYLIGALVLVGFGYLIVRYKKKAPGSKEIFNKKVAEAQKKMP